MIQTKGPNINAARIHPFASAMLRRLVQKNTQARTRSASTTHTIMAASVTAGRYGWIAPSGQKNPEGQTVQLDCVWLEQSDEYDPAAHGLHVPLLAWQPGQQQEPQSSVQSVKR